VNVLQKSVDALQKGLREMEGEVVHLRSQNDMIKLQVNVNEDWESKSVSLLRMYMR
jgi:ribosomal protein L29